MKPYEELPSMPTKYGTLEEPTLLGTDVYRGFVENATKEEFESYLDVLSNAGFQRRNKINSDEKRIWTETFQKENLFATIYFRTQKTHITSWYEKYPISWDGTKLFENIPAMNGVNVTTIEPVDYGAGNYVVTIENTKKCDYELYLAKLEKQGFEKYVDNGKGLDESVFTSTFTKDRLVLTVTYVKKLERTYLSACYDLPLSKHLLLDKNEFSQNPKEAKNELHLPEMWKFGNSFIFKLKNGHFIISDGGFMCESGYFLDYLESLVPDGEKPIIDGWFVSHSHPDHSGVIRTLWLNPEDANRIYVEGFYYNEPNNAVFAFDQGGRVQANSLKNAAQVLHTTTGAHPEIYRPQTGQRYFFNDIVVEIVLGQEQHLCTNYSPRDFNDSSTWCMFIIDGQKCLLGGDGGKGAMDVIMSFYHREYFKLDLFATLHHCLNTYNAFTDFCTIKTALFTRASKPRTYIDENEYLISVSQEWFSREEGPRKLVFPYELGSSEILPHFEWIYNVGEERPYS